MQRPELFWFFELDDYSLYLEGPLQSQSYQAQYDPYYIYRACFKQETFKFVYDTAIMRRVHCIPAFKAESERFGTNM